MAELLANLWIQRIGFVVGGLVLGGAFESVVIRRARKLAEGTRFRWDDLLLESVRGVATLWFGAGGVYLALNLGDVDPLVVSTIRNVLMVLVFGSVVIAAMRRDYIQLSSGEEGWVTDVKGRNTTIQTFPDGNLVTVPNSLLASSIVKNFTLPKRALWVTVEVGVSYDSDLEHVEAVALEVAKRVLAEGGGVAGNEPVLRFHTFGDSSINFDVRMMVREFESQGPVKHEFIKRLHQRFGEEGIEIPFPIRTVIMKGGSGS